MINIKNAATEGLDGLVETLAELGIHPKIVLSSIFNRHDRYELVNGKLVETIRRIIHPRVGDKALPDSFMQSSGEFSSIGYAQKGYVIEAEFVDGSGPLHLIIKMERYSGLELVMTAPMEIGNSKPVFVRDLPRYAYGAGMEFDLSNDHIRDAMRRIADKRVPVQYFAPGDNASTMYGNEVEEGKYDVCIHIELQKPDSRYLKCFVASLLSYRRDGGELTAIEHAEGIPESNYQADEGHYCITDEGKDSYPLIPIKLNKIRRLNLQLETRIGERGDYEKPIFTVTGDVPLTLGRQNNLYVRGFLGPGHFFEVRRFPDQDIIPDAAILYRRPSSFATIVEDLNAGMREFQSVKIHFEGVLNR